MPNVYVSQAVMRITPSQISANIATSTLNQQLTERILQMEQEILSRTSLSGVIQDPRLDLYKSDRAKRPLEDVIEDMRTKDVHIGIVDLPGAVTERQASAFNISFSYYDAHKAQQVVQTLITRFTEVNLTSQRNQMQVVTSFVHDELSIAKANLQALDDALTRFRIDNSGKLPEESTLNIAQMTAIQQNLAATNDALNRIAEQKLQLETHLQSLESQKELLNMFERDTDVSPTSPVARQNERLLILNKQVTDLESSLAQMRLIYSPKYPDIRDAEKRLTELKKQRDEVLMQQEAEESRPKEPAPRKKTSFQQAQQASQIQAQIDQTNTSLKSLEIDNRTRTKAQAQDQKMLAGYQERLAATSSIQAKYADLIRDQKAATEKLTVLEGKEQLTEQSDQLLQRKAGEQLEVLDPPNLPEKPSKPNRVMVVGAGVGIAFVLGLALAGLQEVRDTSLKNLKDVRAYTNLPVLSSIPLLENTMLVRRKRRLSYLAWSAGVILGLMAVSIALYYHYTIMVS
jgi:succinoglycan biosynthesis transport protein ExoP